MRIALLGADDVTLAVAAAAVRIGRDQIVQAAAVENRVAELEKLIPGLRIDDDWERLLDSTAIEAVVVAADQPAVRVEQLRRLIQLGMPTLVSHPISLSMLDCYELEMIRRETGCVVLPYLPARWHPAAAELQTLVADGNSSPLGAVEQIVFQRFIGQRDRETVLRQFAIDADLLQYIAGNTTKLHALGSTSGSGTYANLAVQLSTGSGLVCRWLVNPPKAETSGEMTLIASKGKAVWSMPAGGLQISPASEFDAIDFRKFDVSPAAEIALEKLAAARAGREVDPTWAEAARTVELTETIDRSLARGRTIDLHREEFTDIGTFKGTMASLGCGLLMAGLVLVVFVAMVRMLAVQAGWNGLVQTLDFWPYLLLLVLGVFLILQLLVLIGKPPKLPNRQGEPDRQNAADRHDFSP